MKKNIALFTLIMVIFFPIGLIALSSSEAGSRWLLRGMFSSIPGQVTVENIQGCLLDHIKLIGFRYKTDTEIVAVKNIDFLWEPSKLFSGILKIDDLTLKGLGISITTTTKEEKKPTDLEAIAKLPIQLDIGNLLITDVTFTRDRQVQSINKLQLSAKTVGNQFRLLSLAINSNTINATANGAVALEKGFPLNFQVGWQVNADKSGWQGSTTISGDIYKLVFDNRLTTPFKLALQGQIEDVLKKPRISVKGDWQNLKWPVTAKPPQIQSQQGHFDLVGLPNNYRLTINGQFNQQYLPQALLAFDGNGGLDAMTINKLELKSNTGILQVMGHSSWGDLPQFDLTATGKKFNPGIIIPELPGSLTFNSHLKGKLDPNALYITAEIDKLTGQLRKQPVNASGKLALNGGQLTVEALHVASGANKIAVDGVMSQANGGLELSINMPALGTLWPTLGGSFQGKGYLQGGWQHPEVKFEAEGNRLRFTEHSIKDLILNIDYHGGDKNISTANASANASANAIKSGSIEIDKLSIDGKGTPNLHVFNAEIYSSHAIVSSVLKGGLIANSWKGELSKLDIDAKNNDKWLLKNSMPLRVEKKQLGFDVRLNEGCLIQQTSELCTQGFYLENGDLGLQLFAKAIPTDLLQVYLPEQMAVKSLINGNVDIKRQKNVLNGRYRVDLAPARVTIKNKDAKQEISLGQSSLSGNIKGDKVSADIAVLLAGSDYLQGKLLMDIGKSQALSGTIAASMADFTMIKPFVPQLSAIKGILKADLSLQGLIKKPLVSGHIDITDGLVETGQIGLHAIDLHLVALGNRSNGIQLHGSTVPIVPNKHDAPEKISLISKINLDAGMQLQDFIAGNFRLTLPANTTLSFDSQTKESQGIKKVIVLGATSLSGRINGEALTADLDMALIKQDYIHGKLEMGVGKSQALSAQLTASIREFAMLEPFAPQLSNVKGLLKADLTAKGTTKNPLINGNVYLTNGAVDVDKLGLAVRNINLQAITPISNSDLIQLKGSAKSGEGFINFDGSIGLQPELHYPILLTLTGKDFDMTKLPEAQIAVSPSLQIAYSNQQKQISGQLAIPKAILKIQDIPENAVKVSEDEVILGEEKPEGNAASSLDINADIDVMLGKKVSFTGQGLQTNLLGNLKIRKTGEKMVMQGNVNMDKASYKRFGQDLTVRKGQFLFNGPVDNPWLDVEAIRLSKSKKVTAILGLSGSLKIPQTRISSEPSLPESEVLAYLVTGGPLNQVSKSDSNLLASAALAYGAGKVTWLADKFGIDEVKVEEGSKLQDTLLVMGQYLTPDFYIGTKVGLFNKQAALVLKHKLTDTINVETQAGTSQRIKLNYEFDGD